MVRKGISISLKLTGLLLMTILMSSFILKDTSAREVIKKMNAFYYNKAISLTYKVSYETKKGDNIEEKSASVRMQNKNYRQEDDSQLLLSNSSYLILVDKVGKQITVRKKQQEEVQKSSSFLDFEKLIDSSFSDELSSIKETEKNYSVTIENDEVTMILTISKNNYSLKSFQYLFKQDEYYNSLKVDYSNIKVSKEFSASIFSSKSIIKKSRGSFRGIGIYKGYTITN